MPEEETAEVMYPAPTSGRRSTARCGRCNAQLTDDAFMVKLERCPFCNVKLVDEYDVGNDFGGFGS